MPFKEMVVDANLFLKSKILGTGRSPDIYFFSIMFSCIQRILWGIFRKFKLHMKVFYMPKSTSSYEKASFAQST